MSSIAAIVAMVVSAEEEKSSSLTLDRSVKIQAQAPEQKKSPPSWYYRNPSSPSLASTTGTWQRGMHGGGIPSMSSNDDDLLLAANATNADDVNAEVLRFSEYYEEVATDHRRMIFMILLFLGFMVLYIGFCAYYRKRNKVRRAVEDTSVRTRERQRSANQVRNF